MSVPQRTGHSFYSCHSVLLFGDHNKQCILYTKYTVFILLRLLRHLHLAIRLFYHHQIIKVDLTWLVSLASFSPKTAGKGLLNAKRQEFVGLLNAAKIVVQTKVFFLFAGSSRVKCGMTGKCSLFSQVAGTGRLRLLSWVELQIFSADTCWE